MWEIERERARVWICVQWCWNMLRPFFKRQGSVKMFRPHRIQEEFSLDLPRASDWWWSHPLKISYGDIWGSSSQTGNNKCSKLPRNFLPHLNWSALTHRTMPLEAICHLSTAQLNWCHDLPVGSMFLGDSMLLAMSHDVAEGVTWCHLSQIVSKERMWIRVSSPWLPDFHIQNN